MGMNPQERQTVLDQFTSGEARFLALADGLTPEQWHFRQSPERWSIAEIFEHVILVERRVLAGIQKHLASGEPPADRPSNAAQDAELASRVRMRTQKIQAPEPVRPSGQWSADELTAEFRKVRANSLQFASETAGNLRGYFMKHVLFGDIDCYQWILVLAGHTHRHAQQIEEIKSDPVFQACRSSHAGA
jgi:hypothetical protein